MSEVDVITATIAAGQSLSAEVDIGNKSLVGILIPTNWTTAGLSFQVSPDGGVTWGEVTTAAGGSATPYGIASITAGTVYYVAIDPTALVGALAFKIRSGTLAVPVVQANLVSLQLVTRLAF